MIGYLASEAGRRVLGQVQVNLPFGLLQQYLPAVRQIGLRPEIYFSGTALDALSPAEIEAVSRSFPEDSITFHGPFLDLSPGAADERIRRVSAWRFGRVLDLVPLLRPRLIVFHAGYDRWRFNGEVELWLESSLRTWTPLARRAEDLSVRLALENTFEEEPAILRRLLERIGSPAVGFCLDPGHAHIFSRVPALQWVEELGSALLEVHLHDNHRQADEHLPIGQGEIDFPALFSGLRSKGLQPVLTLEPHCLEHLEPSLRAMERYLTG
ncbi:MAG: sugar phosphate isomerase/epimerase [Deltaproteobacteria bacterium]|nr:sugar phosphate isomerase/epimerase [Deltaproteobacteria bacterium]